MISLTLACALALGFQSSAFAAAKPPTIRPELAKPLQAAQTALAAKNYAEAQTQLNIAKAIPKQTPYEAYIIARLDSSAAIGRNDLKTAQADYEQLVASSELPPEEKLAVLETYVKLSYANKDFVKTADAIQKYKAAGGNKPELLGMYAQSLYLGGNYKAASAELTQQINALQAAGQRPTDTQLQLLASCSLKQNDMVGYAAALEKIVMYTPKPEYWLDLIVRTAGRPGFSEKLDLDLYRLRRATGSMQKAGDYMDAAQLALSAGFPGEAQKIMDEGYQSQLLGQGPDAPRQQTLKGVIAKKMTEDKATLAEGEKAAAKLPTGDGLVATGFNLVAYGQFDKGLPLIEQGIAKGGLKLPDQARLHQGYAYLLAGRKDQAQKAFLTVQGTDGSKDLARLWMLQMKAPTAAK